MNESLTRPAALRAGGFTGYTTAADLDRAQGLESAASIGRGKGRTEIHRILHKHAWGLCMYINE